MTISSTTTKNIYNGNGSTVTFAYTFEILANTDLLVQLKVNSTGVITTKTINTDYTVTNVGQSTGGNVVFTIAPATGMTIIIIRNMAALQNTNFTPYSVLDTNALNTALDRLTMLDQQLGEISSRTITLDASVSPSFNAVLPVPTVNQGGYVVTLNGSATGFTFASLVGTGSYLFQAGTGILTQTSVGVSQAVTNVGTTNEIVITNGDGTSGNPTYALSATLVAPGSITSTTSITATTSLYVTTTTTLNGATTANANITFSTGAINYAAAVTIASASSVAVGGAASNNVIISGTTTITGFDTVASGIVRYVAFSGILQLTYNATSFILPSAANITTAAGDESIWKSLGSGNWKCIGYLPTSGKALIATNTTAAIKSDQTTGTSTTVFVNPGVQQYHASAAKFWVNFQGTGSGAVTINASYNVSSVTRNTTGNYTVNLTTAFTSANFCPIATINNTNSNAIQIVMCYASLTSSAVTLQSVAASGLSGVDTGQYYVCGFGTQ